MSETPRQQSLLPPDPPRPDLVVINGGCVLRIEGSQRALLVRGLPMMHYQATDRAAEAYAMVSLVEQGWALQVEVARAFACDERTVRRHQHRYAEGGLAALGRTGGRPCGARRGLTRDRQVLGMKADGAANREIARRLGVDEKLVRKCLRRVGWKTAAPPRQMELDMEEAPARSGAGVAPPAGAAAADQNLSGPPAAPVGDAGDPGAAAADRNLSGPPAAPAVDEVPFTADSDPRNRSGDRLLAYMGLLDDAMPLFADATAVPRAGVLLAVPALVRSGVFDVADRVWGTIGPAFFGLRTTLMTLLLMALMRIKRPEGLKEHSPPDFGRILGLDRAPEVKTVRRKFQRLVERGSVETFGRLLARLRVSAHGPSVGFLYIDGHVRVYYGKHKLPKTHAARINAIMPATSDYWVNDQAGDPLFVITAPANAALTKMLPTLLAEIRRVVGDKRLTIVFDRGGWSPKLFVDILAAGFDILTYRKGAKRKLPRRAFHERRATLDGREVSYILADQEIRLLRGKLRLRQVTRLVDKHQTQVLTSRRDLPDIEVAYRMFERWRQENFFKYMDQEFLIDALVDYDTEADDPNRDVPNPRRITLDKHIKVLRAEIAVLKSRATDLRICTHAGIASKIDPVAISQKILASIEHLRRLLRQRERTPVRVHVGETTDDAVLKLAPQKKHLSNVLKMVAYQAESDLLRQVAPHYSRSDQEGRTLIQAAMSAAADIAVVGDELRLTIASQSSPHRTHAITALCAQLSATRTTFPGTNLRLVYAVAPHPPPPLVFAKPDIS